MDETWTLNELVSEAATRIEALPAPKNGQVRAVPDERTIRYYAQLGLLDRPAAMRGRTALYGARHLAQVVAIKRLQSAGRSLAEIEAMWPTLDDVTLARMTGVDIPSRPKARAEFWKERPQASGLRPPQKPLEPSPEARGPRPEAQPLDIHIHLRIDSLSADDIAAIRAAAAPLLDELARRGLILEEEP